MLNTIIYNPTNDIAILATYFGNTIYNKNVKTRQSTMPNKSLSLPEITGMVAIASMKNKLAAKKLMSIGAKRFFSTMES